MIIVNDYYNLKIYLDINIISFKIIIFYWTLKLLMSFLNYCITCDNKPIPENPKEILTELLKFRDSFSIIEHTKLIDKIDFAKPSDQEME